ncbi:hypothetical protein RDWZM_009860, partial [Blomia tropicalis]
FRNIDELDELATKLIDADLNCGSDDKSDHYDNLLSELIDSCKALIKQDKEQEQENQNKSSSSKQESKLPMVSNDKDLKLPKFDGTHCNYLQFEKLFTLTYENERYQPHQQFIAFKNLTGEHSKGLIGGLQPTVEGLVVAKQRMKQKYSDSYRIRMEVQTRLDKSQVLGKYCTCEQIRDFMVNIEECLQALKDCNSGEEYINSVFFRSLTKKLSSAIVDKFWNEYKVTNGDILVSFLKYEVENMIKIKELTDKGDVTNDKVTKSEVNKKENGFNNKSNKKPIVNDERLKCQICSESHNARRCQRYTASERRQIVVNKNICMRCLIVGHKVETCRSPYLCPVCKEPHSSVVCTEFEKKHRAQSNLAATMMRNQSNQLLYQTMVGYIHHQPVRILLDSGCGRSIITEKMAKRLNLPIIGSKKVNINSPIASQTLHSDRSTEGSIQSHDGSFQMNVAFNVVQDLKGLVLNTLSTDQFNKIQDLGFPLNNERPISNYPIEIIIGIEYYNSIWTGVPIQIEGQLWIQQSKFGWIVSGINISEQPSSEINFGFIKTEDEVKQDEFKFIEKSSKVEDEFLDKYIDNVNSIQTIKRIFKETKHFRVI